MPNEVLRFIEDAELWQSALDHLSSGNPFGTLKLATTPSLPADFIVTVEGSHLSFRITFSYEYPYKRDAFVVNIHGNIDKTEQERWMNIIQQSRKELSDTDFPVYELLSSHLLPLLHEQLSSSPHVIPITNHVSSSHPPESRPLFHALLTSHHLISSQKRRSFKKWSEEHSLSGFAKIGYPGVIYCTGCQPDVQAFVSKVKNMQWLALHTKFIEPLPIDNKSVGSTIHRSWKEVEKIGEVVDEMRKYGREEYAYEFGIGSGKSKH